MTEDVRYLLSALQACEQSPTPARESADTLRERLASGETPRDQRPGIEAALAAYDARHEHREYGAPCFVAL